MAASSPFPGIDPYLEGHWRDVHAELIALSRTQLNLSLPADLVARMEERAVIDRMDYEAEEHTETYVTILTAEGDELVTVIEFLSPTNKLAGPGREEYRRKREELVGSKINFVEVDLVRQGSWRDLLRPVIAPVRIETAYRAITRRFHPIRRVELFPMSIRQPLDRIPIPLRDQDAEISLDLQELVSHAYRNGRYDHTDYTKPCDPPLDREDAQWADELLRSAGLRGAS